MELKSGTNNESMHDNEDYLFVLELVMGPE